MDTYHQELRLEHGVQSRELLDTIERQVNNLVTRIHPDIVVVTDPTGAIVAVQGKKRADWPAGRRAPTAVHRCVGPVRRASRRGVSIRRRPARTPGRTEHRARRAAARDGAGLRLRRRALLPVGAGTVIVSHDAIVASTLPPSATRALTPTVLTTIGPSDDNLILEGQHYAVKLLFRHGGAAVYALDSIDASAEPLLAAAFRATLLHRARRAGARRPSASLWLAQTVARPIDTLSRSLTAMTQSRDFGTPIPRPARASRSTRSRRRSTP